MYCGFQAAIYSTMIPSSNFTPSITSASQCDPFRHRHVRWAQKVSLKTMVEAVSLERQPRILAVRSRTVAKVDSMGLVVRMCSQCSAGKS